MEVERPEFDCGSRFCTEPQEWSERRETVRAIAGGGRRQSRRNGRDGIGRRWEPGALSKESGRCVRSETLKGKRTS